MRTRERDAPRIDYEARTRERDDLQVELDATRDRLEAAEQKAAVLGADLGARTEESVHRAEGGDAARRRFSRAKGPGWRRHASGWGEDRQALDAARQALAAVAAQIEAAAERPIE